MSTIIAELNGFTLSEFLTTQLYSPAEKAAIKKSNADYYAEKERIRLAKFRSEQEAKRPKQLSEQQRYEIQVAEDQKRKQEQQTRDDFQANLLKQHEQYLQSDVERATICCNSLLMFLQEYTHWISRKYTLEIATLDCQPSLFVGYMIAPESSKSR